MRWEDREPTFGRAREEVARALSRALRRWPLVVALAALITAAIVVRKAFQPPRYPAAVALLVVEGDVVAVTVTEEEGDRTAVSSSPRTAARLADYVGTVVFSDAKLREIMRRQSVTLEKLESNPRLAVASFRDDIDIDVSQNNFLLERRPGDPPRFARIEISYTAPDPRVALMVAQDLADAVIDHEAAQRRELLDQAKRFQAEIVDALDAEVGRREGALAEAQLAAQGLPGVSLVVVNELRAVENLRNQLAGAQRELEELDLRSSAEQKDLGLAFTRVDWRSVEVPRPRGEVLLRLGVITLLASLLLSALAVGAFDGRVYDAADLRRLGQRPLGTVAAWPPQARAAERGKAWTRRTATTARG